MSETPEDPRPHRSAPRSTALRVATIIVGALAALLAVLRWNRSVDGSTAPLSIDAAAVVPPGEPLADRPHLRPDPALGVSPAPDTERSREITDLDGGSPRTVTITRDRLGLLRAGDLPDPIPGPRILLLGDEAISAGAATGEDLGSLLEAALRARSDGDLAAATVLTAATSGDGLAAYVLRAARLAPPLRPALVVVCVDPADDVLALADPRLPHPNVSGRILPPRSDAPADPLGLAGLGEGPRAALLHRNLGQLFYLMADPRREAALTEQLRGTLRELRDTTPRAGAGLLVVVLPNADTTAPVAFAAAAGPAAKPMLAQGGSRRAREALTTALRDLGFAWFDAAEALAGAADPAALFTSEGLATATAQRRIAERLVERIAQRLASM